MKVRSLKWEIIIRIIVITLIFYSFGDNSISQAYENKVLADTGILRTNSLGNILGGDVNDWDFNVQTYKDVISKEYFQTPVYKDSIGPRTGEPSAITYEIQSNNNVVLKWSTNVEKDFGEFHIERARKISDYDQPQWKEIGMVKAVGNTEGVTKYEYIDRLLKTGMYLYRLKVTYFNGKYNYYNLPNEVIIKQYLSKFQFYPAYPNPVISTSNISFFLPQKDTVSLYFLDGNDTTYILDHEPQEKGFYKLTIDKNSLGFKNVIKRLYISCKSCRKEKNFGDIEFN